MMANHITISTRMLALISTAIFVLIFSLTILTSGLGAMSNNFFPKTWSSDVDYNIGLRHNGFQTGAFNSAVHFGDDPWDNVSGNWFDFTWGEIDQGVATWSGCSSVPTGGVWVGTGAITALARESTCTNSSGITRSSITVDRTGRDWHISSSATVPSGKTDLRAILVHEFGHAAGFVGHFSSSCTGLGRDTMCPSSPASSPAWRTLESRDISNIQAAY